MVQVRQDRAGTSPLPLARSARHQSGNRRRLSSVEPRAALCFLLCFFLGAAGARADPIAVAAQALEKAVSSNAAGETAAARIAAQKALSLYEEQLGARHLNVAKACFELGSAAFAAENYTEAEPMLERAHKLFAGRYLPTHELVVRGALQLGLTKAHLAKFAECRPLLELALAGSRKTQGPDHADTLRISELLAQVIWRVKDYESARALLNQVMAARLKAKAPNFTALTATCLTLVNLEKEERHFDEADAASERLLKFVEKSKGANSPEMAHAVTDLAELRRSRGAAKAALPLYEQALRILEKGDREDQAAALENLALCQADASRLDDAIRNLEKALAFYRQQADPENLRVAHAMASLGEIYGERGDYSRSESLLKDALRILRAKGGSPRDILGAALNQAGLANRRGLLKDAVALLEPVVAETEEKLDPFDGILLGARKVLGELLINLGDFQRGLAIYEKAAAMGEKRYGKDSPIYAASLDLLGLYAMQATDYRRAEAALQEAYRIRKLHAGEDELSLGVTLNKLGMLYFFLHNFGQAEDCMKQSLAILERRAQPEDNRYLVTLDNLANVYQSTNRLQEAEKLYRKCYPLLLKAHGPEDDDTLKCLNNLASNQRLLNHTAEAEVLFRQVLEIRRKKSGEASPDTITAAYNLGQLLRKTGRLPAAEKELRAVLKITRATFGRIQQLAISSARELAVLLMAEGKLKEARTLAVEAELDDLTLLENILACTSEQQRLQYLAREVNPFTVLANLGEANTLCTLILRRKGLVLDSLLEDSAAAGAAGATPEAARDLASLADARQHLRQVLLAPQREENAEAQKRRTAETAALKKKVEDMEAAVAKYRAGTGLTRNALKTTIAEVQAALPAGSALIEWIGYEELGEARAGELRYGAVVLPASGEPRWVPLGYGAEVEKLCQSYLEFVDGTVNEKALTETLTQLYALIWKPLEAVLPTDHARLILSPDGSLNVLSFATLLEKASGPFLAERFDLSYVGSGRDLLRPSSPATSQELIVFANPSFSAPPTAAPGTMLASARRSLPATGAQGFQESFGALKGTLNELERLQTVAQAHHWRVKPHVGPEATEVELNRVRAPRVLHLATHGFFLPSSERTETKTSGASAEESRQSFGVYENPMHQSGLVLAGANLTLAAWQQGRPGPPTGEDGFVTAEEVAALHLRGTELVVLSACETGRGAIVSGEGVLGLRRGFAEAGAEKLLLTLWQIGDDSTAQIIPRFYERWQVTGDAALALSQVQREELVARRKAAAQDHITTAVSAAGPFILSTWALKPATPSR